MKRALTILLAMSVTLSMAGIAFAGPQEAHYEGYTMGSNPGPAGTQFNGRGLVTALVSPLVSDFVANEYTWVISGLISNGSTLSGHIYTTVYSTTGATFTIWEDPCQDARPTFYNCPSDINGLDVRYANNCASPGSYYLRGHFVSYTATFDVDPTNYGEGTFVGTLNWDSGTHLNDLLVGYRGGWTFGGSTVSQYACIPTSFTPGLGAYQQAMTGVIYQQVTKVHETTWGKLRQNYR